MTKQYAVITRLPRSPEDDQRSRMIKYGVMMAIRMVCIGLCLVVHGWWIVLCIAGAVFLPYVAVVLANVSDKRLGTVERPETTPRMIAAFTVPDDGEDGIADVGSADGGSEEASKP